MRTRTAALVAALALVGLVVSASAVWSRLGPGLEVREPEAGPPVPASSSPAPASAGESSSSGRSRAALDASAGALAPRPVRVTMGSVDVDATVRPVGVSGDGQMRLPPDPRVLGWYRFGPAPGAVTGGSVVMAGHLDSRRLGLGPLVRLRDLRAGEDIEVTLSDGTTSSYTVVGLRRFDRQALPAELFSRRGPERLHVITCGGEYLPDAGGYQQNVVVTAAPA